MNEVARYAAKKLLVTFFVGTVVMGCVDYARQIFGLVAPYETPEEETARFNNEEVAA